MKMESSAARLLEAMMSDVSRESDEESVGYFQFLKCLRSCDFAGALRRVSGAPKLKRIQVCILLLFYTGNPIKYLIWATRGDSFLSGAIASELGPSGVIAGMLSVTDDEYVGGVGDVLRKSVGEIDFDGETRKTATKLICWAGRNKMSTDFIVHKANIRGCALLGEAAMWGNLWLVKFLVRELGVDPNSRNGVSLAQASKFGQVETMRYLMSVGVDASSGDNAAIKAAAMFGQSRAVRLLVRNGADPAAGDEFPLRVAYFYNHFEVLKELMGGAVERASPATIEVFREASAEGRVEVVRLILGCRRLDRCVLSSVLSEPRASRLSQERQKEITDCISIKMQNGK